MYETGNSSEIHGVYSITEVLIIKVESVQET